MNCKRLFVCLGLSVFLTACDDAKKTDAQAPTAAEKSHAYQCEDVKIQTTFTGDDGAAVVDGLVLPMKSVPAANGAKYADEQGNSFWAVGDSAGTLLLKDQKSRDCTLLMP